MSNSLSQSEEEDSNILDRTLCQRTESSGKEGTVSDAGVKERGTSGANFGKDSTDTFEDDVKDQKIIDW